jgi:hypothetical protein
VDRQKVSTDRLKKVGTDTAGTPRQMEDAQMLLLQQHPELKEAPVELNVGAASIVSEAKDILKSRKGLTWAQALQAAYRNQKDNIREETKGASTVFDIPVPFTGETKTTFKGGGQTPDTALTLPDTPDPAQLVPGKFYTQGGVTKQWTGKGWVDGVGAELEQEPETP